MNEVLRKIQNCIADKAADFFGTVNVKLIFRNGKLAQLNIGEEQTFRVDKDGKVTEGGS